MTSTQDEQLRPNGARWGLGDTVAKKRGSSWRGKVVGFYATENTEIGYSVESMFEPGSVQVWPEAALEDWVPSLPAPGTAGEVVEIPNGDPDHTDCDGPSGGGRFYHPALIRSPQAPATGGALIEHVIAALKAEQDRLDGEDYLMDTSDCINVIRETVTTLTGGAEGEGV